MTKEVGDIVIYAVTLGPLALFAFICMRSLRAGPAKQKEEQCWLCGDAHTCKRCRLASIDASLAAIAAASTAAKED